MGYGKANSAFTQIRRPCCPFRKFCIFLHGENPHCVLEQRDYLSRKVDELELAMDIRNRQYRELLANYKELEDKTSHLEDELAQALKAPFIKYEKKEVPENPKKRGAPVGHPGWFRGKPDQVNKTVDAYLDNCPLCDSENISPCNHTTEHIQEDIANGKLTSTCFVRCYYWCGNCKSVVHDWGENEIPNAFIGPEARAKATFLRHQIKVFYDSAQQVLEYLCGLTVVPCSIVGFDRKFAQTAELVYENLKKSLTETPFMHPDETGWKRGWLWILTNLDIAFFHIDESRGSQVVIDHLGEHYGGILISDFWSTYRSKVDAFAKQKCTVHLLRDVKELLKDETLGLNTKNFLLEFKTLFKDAIFLHNTHTTLPHAEYRLAKKDILKRFKKLCRHTELEHHETANIRKRLITFADELFVFLEFPALPPTNNAAEQGIRNAVLFRKITFGNMTARGKRDVSIIMTIIRTAMLQKLNPIEIVKKIMLNTAPVMPEAP